MIQPIHILNQMGVLSSFSVAKKVTDDDVKNFFNKQKKSGKTERQIADMLKEKILGDIQEAMRNNKIPGLITSQDVAKQLGLDQETIARVPELNRLLMVIANKLTEKNYDKMALCYFINSLVATLNLSERDFEKFHQRNSDGDENDEFTDEFDDDDDGEDEPPE